MEKMVKAEIDAYIACCLETVFDEMVKLAIVLSLKLS